MSALAGNPLPIPTAKIRNVLFATDFSDASMVALPYATGIARKLRARLYLCHILVPSTLIATVPDVAPILYRQIQEDAACQLTTLAHGPELAGVDVKTTLCAGAIEDELANQVGDKKIDLIVAGTHGRSGLRKLLIGSAVEAICRGASCPVLTVGPGLVQHRTSEFGRILFPTDLSEDSKRVLPYLRDTAEQYQSQITILHVMPAKLAADPEAPQLSDPIRRTMSDTFRPELTGLKVELLIAFGEVIETVLQTAWDQKADLIAMGIRNTFLPMAHLKSSTTYRIISAAHCPVLTYRHREEELQQ